MVQICNTVWQYPLKLNIRFHTEIDSLLSVYLREMNAYGLSKTGVQIIMSVLFVQVKTRYNPNAH